MSLPDLRWAMDNSSRFEPVSEPRHRIDFVDGREWIVVRATRNWLILPFYSFWLICWTFGGVMAIRGLLTGDFGERGFLAIWLVGWAFGWVYAAGTILWQLAGRSMIAVGDGALIHEWRMPLFSRKKRYALAEVRNLRSAETGSFFGWGRSMSDMPPFLPGVRAGSVKFDYGARTVALFPGLDESEGRMIAARLERYMPARH